MANDPAVLAHQQWLGYVQPVGLVVSIPAMLDANARINQNSAPEHRSLLGALPTDKDGEPQPVIRDFPEFAERVLGWQASDLNGAPGSPELPASLDVVLPEYGETLRPTYALREFEPKENESPWILLAKVLPPGNDFDSIQESDARKWQASPQAKFERLLRSVHVPIGLLVNEREIRLVYAPEKELSGHITFKLSEMVTVAGRPIFAAFHMLLCFERLYSLAKRERLPAILENSRKYQNVVSTQLAKQVLEALYELLRGFQAADDQTRGELLRSVLATDPDHVYRGLLTILLRMVFILYAEDRGLLPTDAVYSNHYSITGLYERLRIDNGRYPDTMNQRYGAWAQLLTLFRLIYEGGSHGAFRVPAREGYLFDPDRYPFLEGRHDRNEPVHIPRVSDGVLYRVLSKLVLLDGERISYRTLAVEQIGSVYEAIMGFQLHVASGPSIAIKAVKKHGAPTTINLEALLEAGPDKRSKWLTDQTDQKLAGQASDALKSAKSIEDLQAALARKIAREVTPQVVAKDAMIFQPSDERRRSGSHYTPKSLTAPIVEAALSPVLSQLGENPTPAQILNLKVCDPAMGSGAFLVEVCRQLGDALSKAWHAHEDVPVLPPDEDEELHAQRLVAQRCLYGVDKNPMAVDLSKLSLWLATLAKDHPFTFLDHSLRTGDSLVGLTRKQAASFSWSDRQSVLLDLERELRRKIERVSAYRKQILEARDNVPYATQKQKLAAADDALVFPRLAADLVIAAFFSADKLRARENALTVFRERAEAMLKDPTNSEAADEVEGAVAKLRHGPKGIPPFHWGLEFPEVFSLNSGEQTGGFDAIVGNPPFLGGKRVSTEFGDCYRDWLSAAHEDSNSSSDLVAHFFRSSFDFLRQGGCVGLISTNTIAQGDTRYTGLRWICNHGGTIYRARKRLRWPGEAAVIVSVVHITKQVSGGPFLLDNRSVPRITAYLFHAGGQEDPSRLLSNRGKSYIGTIALGMGFTFDDSCTNGEASSLAEMDRLLINDPRNAEKIKAYIGGEEVNDSPTQAGHRYIIDFGSLSEEEAKGWPDLYEIVFRKVKPYRDGLKRDVYRNKWWQFGEKQTALYTAVADLDRILVLSRVSQHGAFTFLDRHRIFADLLVAFCISSFNGFCTLQCRVHEVWARFFASSLEDRLRYTPSDCFETFPFPTGFEGDQALEAAGKAYYEFRADLMIRNNEGLTKTYNRFHDPNEYSPEIKRLRELHAEMDCAVIDAYGWEDLKPVCEFFPEFDDEGDADESDQPKRKKYRYRWPDEIHDIALARLLELNREQAMEEGQLLPTEPRHDNRNGRKSSKRRKQEPASDAVQQLFE